MNAFVSLTETGLFAVKGSDAKKFLQGQLTCHLDEITSNHSSFAARCNLQGRVRSFFRLSLFTTTDASFYLIHLPLSMVASLSKDLKQYAMFSQVQIEDLSATYASLGLYGENAPHALEALFGQTFTLNTHACVMVNWENESLQISRLLGEIPRFEIIGPKAAIESLKAKIQNDFAKNTNDLWQQLDIEAKIPAIYPETADAFLPHHLNLIELGAVNFKKGCYLGQEIIARMHYKGKIKKGLYRFSCLATEPLPLPGVSLYSHRNPDNIIGNIVSSTRVNDEYQFLAIIENEIKEEEIYISGQGQKVFKIA
jgi:folate-binding protein YgfZ